ncbi:FAD-binding protein [Actinospica sp. MGRD01-02]|uniref:FAD-binding protein n=1 Tax=Actinospica acidithermotolerans TaxID=2828514 RepID=A0A941EDN7_9ACTN|nr:FAD-binding protein [Actinospica acidithermotolerans]MBR7830810.1 FAD-binding protein [Actinospica acidithermotolerans]
MSEAVRNWARNVEFRAARVHRPASVEELRGVVAGGTGVRVLGTGHSFNRIADTEGDLVVLSGLPAEVEVDAEARTATVAAGMRLAEISSRLHAAGYGLANLPSLPHISLAGACATATHGSGDGNQNLAAFVRSMRLVDADGDVVELARGADEDFAGYPVGLGALGVVTHLTVDVQPTFDVAQYVYVDASLDELIEKREDAYAIGYSVSTFTNWADGRCNVWLKLRADAGRALIPPQRDWLGGTLATAPSHPVPGEPAETCTPQLGVPGPWFERLPHFRPEFTPSKGDELQSEFFVPRARAGEAFEAVRRIGGRIAPVVLTSEIRSIAADDLWLSPAYERDCFALHFTWIPDRAAVTPVLAALGDALLPLGARPHWGKLFVGGPAAALATYPRAEDFRRLLERRDPAGRFRNEFINRLF